MKRKFFIGFLILIGFSFFLTTNSHACRNDLSKIVSPKWFEELNSHPVGITVQLDEAARPGTFRAWLNRKNITDKFVYNENENQMTAAVGLDDGLRIKVSGEQWRGHKINIIKTKVRDSTRHRDIDFRAFYVKVEAMETIGPEGGVVEVTDPDSAIYGVKIEVPENTLDSNRHLSISLAPNDIQSPGDNICISEFIEFKSSAPLNGYVFITFPLKTSITEGDSTL